MIKTVSVQELCEQIETDTQTVLIDLRSPAEFMAGHVAQARNIPLGTISVHQILAEWSRDAEGKPIYFICQSGGQSQQMLDELDDLGYRWAQCVAGGMVAWYASGLPVAHAAGQAVIPMQERLVQVAAGLFAMAGSVAGMFVHEVFFSIPVLVAAGLLLRGLTGWPGLCSVFGRKGGAGL